MVAQGTRGGAGKAARRRKQRQRRRFREREAFNIVNKMEFPNMNGLAPTYSRMGFSEAVPSENYEPMEPQLVGNMGNILPVLSHLGSTATGQKWALKHLHPNGETVTSAAGIPDHTQIPVVTPEYRSNYVIEGTGTSTTTDNLDIIFPGTNDLAFMYRRYPTGATPVNEWVAIYYYATNPRVHAYAAGQSGENVNIYSGQATAQYTEARGMYAGLTITHDAPALYDQGRLVAAQLPLMRTGEFTALTVREIGDPGNQIIAAANVISMGVLPLSEDELFQASPGAIVHEAREGLYMPLRFNEPVQIFSSLQTHRVDSEGTADHNTPYVLGFQPGNVSELVAFQHGPAGETSGYNVGTEAKFNFLTGVILIRGVSAAANFSVKTRVGVEAQVQVGRSPVSVFQHASPLLDRLAMDRVTEIGQRIPMAFPACYNDLGGIIDVIKGILGGVKQVGKVIGDMGIPLISDVAGTVTGIMGKLGLSPRRNMGNSTARMLRAMRNRY